MRYDTMEDFVFIKYINLLMDKFCEIIQNKELANCFLLKSHSILGNMLYNVKYHNYVFHIIVTRPNKITIMMGKNFKIFVYQQFCYEF